MKSNQPLKKLQLGISAIVVIAVGLVYGLNPEKLLPAVFGFEVHNTELKNIFRAVMGLYIGFGWLFIVGIRKPEYWKMATLVSVVFTGGLALGRIISTLFDGFSAVFTLALATELALMFWGILNLKNKKFLE